jgi:hypothetical protein
MQQFRTCPFPKYRRIRQTLTKAGRAVTKKPRVAPGFGTSLVMR